MNELSFLVELLLHHKVPKAIRELVAERIKVISGSAPQRPVIQGQQQAPSTQAALARHTGLDPGPGFVPPTPEPVAVVAQTPATVAALNSRQEAINAALSGKVDKVSGRPRKF